MRPKHRPPLGLILLFRMALPLFGLSSVSIVAAPKQPFLAQSPASVPIGLPLESTADLHRLFLASFSSGSHGSNVQPVAVLIAPNRGNPPPRESIARCCLAGGGEAAAHSFQPFLWTVIAPSPDLLPFLVALAQMGGSQLAFLRTLAPPGPAKPLLPPWGHPSLAYLDQREEENRRPGRRNSRHPVERTELRLRPLHGLVLLLLTWHLWLLKARGISGLLPLGPWRQTRGSAAIVGTTGGVGRPQTKLRPQPEGIDQGLQDSLLGTREQIPAQGAAAASQPSAQSTAPRKAIDPDFVAQLQAILEASYADEEFTIAALAKMISWSEGYLRKQMRAMLGQSPQEYLIAFRLEKARSMLAESAASIKFIAYRCGFKDAAHFSHAFKRKFGVPPSGLREKVGA